MAEQFGGKRQAGRKSESSRQSDSSWEGEARGQRQAARQREAVEDASGSAIAEQSAGLRSALAAAVQSIIAQREGGRG